MSIRSSSRLLLHTIRPLLITPPRCASSSLTNIVKSSLLPSPYTISCPLPTPPQTRHFTRQPPQISLYDYETMKSFAESPDSKRILIDVREPAEYAAGYIPNAVNLPVNSQPKALTLPEADFEDRFGFAKPDLDREVVFYCKAGVRSGNAAAIAQSQGYRKVSEYKGSWLDWTKNGGRQAT